MAITRDELDESGITIDELSEYFYEPHEKMITFTGMRKAW